MILLKLLKFFIIIIALLFFILVMGVIMVVVIHDYEEAKINKEEWRMAKYIAHWYDQDQVVCDDGPFVAMNKEEAVRKAYERKNGNPPAPMLSLEEVE